MVSKEAVLNCFHDWIDRYGYEHTADEDTVYQRIDALDAVRCCDEDCISRRVAIEAIDDIESEVADGFGFQHEKWREYFCELPAVQPERIWYSCKTPPKHHKDVLVRGTEAIGNVTVYKVMQWDVDTWRPINYAPSITLEEWSEI